MKVSPFYLWFHNPFLNIVEIRSFATEKGGESWYQNSGLLGRACMCYSVSDVTELNRLAVAKGALVNYVK